MRIPYSVAVALLAAFLVVVAPTAALAHVTVSPEGVAPEDYATLTVKAPTEKDIPTTEVRVEVPDGFKLGGVQPMPGWEHRFEEEGGLVTAVVWSGGEIGPREFQQFPVSAQAPKEPGEYAWRAFQTYEDGSVVEWVGPPDSEEPAPVVTVAEGDLHGAATQGSNPEATSTGAITPVAAYGGLGVGALALVAALAALLLRRNR